jgi:glycine dehydrogenase subunit 2
MVEPTESEGIEELDRFVEAMQAIALESEQNPDLVKKAPHTSPRSRFDEASAARKPVLRWTPAP